MNWNHFLLLLTVLYLGYYTINIIADLYLKKSPPGADAAQDVLFFSEDSQPEIIIYEDAPEKQVPQPDQPHTYPSPAFESTVTVSLKELIRVAQAGLIQYTKAIPY